MNLPEQCPVIHKVTNHSGSAPQKCPIDHENLKKQPLSEIKIQSNNSSAEEQKEKTLNNNNTVHADSQEEESTEQEVVGVFDDDELFPNETPTERELRQIKKVMHMITEFYKKGSDMKKLRADTLVQELEKLKIDENMAKQQLAILKETPKFAIHPKAKEYINSLANELENLAETKKSLENQHSEAHGLFEWSKTIVEVCKWLEANLEEYISVQCPDSNTQTPLKPKVPELSLEKAKVYAKGLDEIVYNLQESQDFFSASVDGRLLKYHQIECEIIESQLKVLSNFSKENPRREFLEEELMKDLTFVKSNMKVDPASTKRRTKMLENHKAFFNVLKFHKEKLGLLGLSIDFEKKYDPKYNHYN